MADDLELLKARAAAERERAVAAQAGTATQDVAPGSATTPRTVQERVQQEFGLEDYGRRGSVLPYGVTREGVEYERQAEEAKAAGDRRAEYQLLSKASDETEWALPQVAVNLLESFSLPKHVAKGGEVTAEDAVGMSLDFLTPATAAKLAKTRSVSRSELRKTAPSTQELLDEGGKQYKAVRGDTGFVSGEDFASFVAGLEDLARQEKFTPQITGDSSAVLKLMQDSAFDPQDMGDLLTWRRILSDAANTVTDDKRRDRATASMMLERLDDLIDNTLGSLKARAARQYWQRARKSELIEAAIERAKLQASGFENGLRTQFRALLRNPKKNLRGFTDDEINHMRKVVNGGNVQNFLRGVGKMGFTGNQGANSNALTGAAGIGGAAGLGYMVAGPPGAMLAPAITQGATMVARGAADRVAQNRGELQRALAATGGVMPRGLSPIGAGVANNAARINPALVRVLAEGDPDIVGRDPRTAFSPTPPQPRGR